MKGIHCIVSGLVQGVYFRAWTRDKAGSLGLKGWVRNLRDGRVEVLAVGEDASLDELVDFLHKGSPSSRVEKVEKETVDVSEDFTGFDVRYS